MSLENSDKQRPNTQDLINKNAGTKNATLRTLAIGSSYGIVNSKDLNSFNSSPQNYLSLSPQQIANFDLWVTEVNYGYGVDGVTAASHFYNKFYAQYFRKDPIRINGICRHEAEYNALATFIRKQQVNASVDENNLLELEIPGAGIRAIGVIPNFVGGIVSDNTGIPVAPDFQFEFIVFRDLNDPADSNASFAPGEYQISTFLKDPAIQINDSAVSYAIYSPSVNNGPVKPFNLEAKKYQKVKWWANSNPNEDVNGGTNGARGS